jgi:hypothetical protein
MDRDSLILINGNGDNVKRNLKGIIKSKCGGTYRVKLTEGESHVPD